MPHPKPSLAIRFQNVANLLDFYLRRWGRNWKEIATNTLMFGGLALLFLGALSEWVLRKPSVLFIIGGCFIFLLFGILMVGLAFALARVMWELFQKHAPSGIMAKTLTGLGLVFIVAVLLYGIFGHPFHKPTARCEDGHYSYSKHRSGTCSWHGGVSEWYPEGR